MILENAYGEVSQCLKANVDLYQSNLTFHFFGNVSQRVGKNLFAIKPSGVDPCTVSEEAFPIIEIESGKQISGELRPSSDTPTHLCLYRHFPDMGGIVHCHSRYATAWCQANRSIPLLGTTHADYWPGDIPITRALLRDETEEDFEYKTGVTIAEKLDEINLKPLQCPAMLVQSHGPFAWGRDAGAALKSAEILEYVAEMAYLTVGLNPDAEMNPGLAKRHFERKNGAAAYYGQTVGKKNDNQ